MTDPVELVLLGIRCVSLSEECINLPGQPRILLLPSARSSSLCACSRSPSFWCRRSPRVRGSQSGLTCSSGIDHPRRNSSWRSPDANASSPRRPRADGVGGPPVIWIGRVVSAHTSRGPRRTGGYPAGAAPTPAAQQPRRASASALSWALRPPPPRPCPPDTASDTDADTDAEPCRAEPDTDTNTDAEPAADPSPPLGAPTVHDVPTWDAGGTDRAPACHRNRAHVPDGTRCTAPRVRASSKPCPQPRRDAVGRPSSRHLNANTDFLLGAGS